MQNQEITIGERIKQIIENHSDSLKEFSEKYDIDYSSLSDLSRGKRNLGMNLAMRLVEKFPGLNLNWLLMGIGDMFLGKNANYADLQILSEPEPKYANYEPGKEMFLKYLEDSDIQERLIEILNKKK